LLNPWSFRLRLRYGRGISDPPTTGGRHADRVVNQ